MHFGERLLLEKRAICRRNAEKWGNQKNDPLKIEA